MRWLCMMAGVTMRQWIVSRHDPLSRKRLRGGLLLPYLRRRGICCYADDLHLDLRPINPGNCRDHDLARSCFAQHASAFVERCARGVDIIDEHDSVIAKLLRVCN